MNPVQGNECDSVIKAVSREQLFTDFLIFNNYIQKFASPGSFDCLSKALRVFYLNQLNYFPIDLSSIKLFMR